MALQLIMMRPGGTAINDAAGWHCNSPIDKTEAGGDEDSKLIGARGDITS